MKRIFLPLVGLALLLAPATFSSCKEDAPKVSHTTSVTVTNDFSKVVEAINQGTLKSEAAIKKLTEAIDKMQADQATKLASIISVLDDVNKTLETKLAAIESAISSQTLSLEGKLDILAEAIKKHLLKQEELTGKITEAIDKLGGTLAERLKQITDAITSTAKTTQEKLDLLMGLINTQSVPLSDKLDAIAGAIGGLTESSAKQLEALSTTLTKLKEAAEASGTTQASVLKQLEEIKAKIGTTPTPPSSEEVEYVDLGLPSGLKWAACNLGATSPEQPGDYYAWGETEPKERYDWDSYKQSKSVTNADGTSYYNLTKYCTDAEKGLDGFTDGKTQLEPVDDVATVKLGSPWRMPTEAEVKELVEGCTWTKETVNDTPCLRATSKANGKSIVICSAGVIDGSDYTTQGSFTGFWTSSLRPSRTFIGGAFSESGRKTLNPGVGGWSRRVGFPIRPVRP